MRSSVVVVLGVAWVTGALASSPLAEPLPANPPPANPTVADLVARLSAARNGTKLAAVRTIRYTGVGESGGFKMGMVRTVARPGSLRGEYTLQGLTQIVGWNGSLGWSINPFSGRRTPDRMDPEDAKGLVYQAELDGPLLAAAAKGVPITNEGLVQVEGSPAWLLRITRPDGTVQDDYLDPDSFLEVKTVTRMTVHGVVDESETVYADYEVTGGILFPMDVSSGARNHGEEGFHERWSRIELNVAAPSVEMPR